MNTSTEYDGPDKLFIGDGSSLPITHTGLISLTLHFLSFKLKDALWVPSATKNLISVSEFCQSNDVSIEFFSFMFVVKDL